MAMRSLKQPLSPLNRPCQAPSDGFALPHCGWPAACCTLMAMYVCVRPYGYVGRPNGHVCLCVRPYSLCCAPVIVPVSVPVCALWLCAPSTWLACCLSRSYGYERLCTPQQPCLPV
eukprot:scaffold78837_cov21-Tisochrysis_lutea.AAC.1